MASFADDELLAGLGDSRRQQLREFQQATNSSDLAAALSALETEAWDVQRAVRRAQGLAQDDSGRGDGGRGGDAGASQIPAESSAALRRRVAGKGRGSEPVPADGENRSGAAWARGPPAADAERPQFRFGPLFAWPFVLALRISAAVAHMLLTALGLRRISAAGIPGGTVTRPMQPDEHSAAMSFERYFESEFGLAHPPLFAGTFTAAREAAHRESRYLVAILWSREHDNARAMGRVLAHPTVVAYLSQPRFLVWAGDLATSSTYGTSLGLHATAFPLLSVFGAATVPYMPTPFGPRVRAKLMQIARMDGLPTPDEMLAPESAAYDEHVHGEYLARTLIRLIDRPVARHGLAISAARRGQQERAEEQRLRQQQDVAYEASLARDRQRELEAQARAEKEQADRDEAERLQREEQHARDLQRQWRWATLARIVREECEDAGLAPDGVGKLSLRLESGRRVVQSFPGDATLQRVFDFVETRETADEWARTGTTPFGSDLSAVQPPARYEHSYEFALVSQFPRVVLDDRAAPLKATLAAKGLWPSAALIVEPLYESESDSDGHDSNTAGA